MRTSNEKDADRRKKARNQNVRHSPKKYTFQRRGGKRGRTKPYRGRDRKKETHAVLTSRVAVSTRKTQAGGNGFESYAQEGVIGRKKGTPMGIEKEAVESPREKKKRIPQSGVSKRSGESGGKDSAF